MGVERDTGLPVDWPKGTPVQDLPPEEHAICELAAIIMDRRFNEESAWPIAQACVQKLQECGLRISRTTPSDTPIPDEAKQAALNMAITYLEACADATARLPAPSVAAQINEWIADVHRIAGTSRAPISETDEPGEDERRAALQAVKEIVGNDLSDIYCLEVSDAALLAAAKARKDRGKL